MPECPGCQTSYDTLPDICPNCDLTLRVLNVQPKLTPHGEELVVLAQFDSQIEAQIVQGRLQGEGLESMIGGSSMEAYMGTNDPGAFIPYQLLVHRRDAPAALRLLAQESEWSESDLARYISMLDEG